MEFEKYELIYKIDHNKSYIRFLGENFFKRNHKLGKIIYENKKFPPMEKIETNILKKDIIKIDLIFYKIIYNKSYMFKDCDSLIKFNKTNYKNKEYCSRIINIYEEESLYDYINESNNSENTLVNILNEIDYFSNYSSIKAESQSNLNYPTISNFYENISLINDKNGKYILTGMFYNCPSLIFVSGISNWNSDIKYRDEYVREYPYILRNIARYRITPYLWKNNNISDMSGIFYNCSSLKSLPDISNWYTKNITNMSTLFYNCSSLISLPDISKWNTKSLINMGGIFSGCSSLKSLPDISKWKTNKVTNLSAIFYNCSSLISLPDISKWNTQNVNYMSGIFYNCSSLISLPDISKWNTNKLTDMSTIFYKCYSLSNLPDISKWRTDNVTDMQGIFYGCFSLLSLPDISIWETNNATNMKEMFSNCLSLSILPDISKFNTNHMSNSKDIFYNCISLFSIFDLNIFNISKESDKQIKKGNKLNQKNEINEINNININITNDTIKDEIFDENYELDVINLNKKKFNKIKNDTNEILANQITEEINKNLKLPEQLNEEKKIIEVIFEKIIEVHFQSEQKINFPMLGIVSNNFSQLEEKLYLEFPYLKKKNIYFVINGSKIKRNLTLEQNKIKDGEHILIFYY